MTSGTLAKAISGAFIAGAIAFTLEEISKNLIFIPTPGVAYIAVVVACGYYLGLAASTSACVVLLAIAALFAFQPGHPFNHSIRVVLLVIFLPATATLVGLLKLKSERNFARIEARFETLFREAPLGILLIQGNKLVLSNQHALDMLGGAQRQPIVGKTLWQFIHPDYVKVIQERIAQLQGGQLRVDALEEQWIDLDGKILDVEVTGAGLLVEGVTSRMVILRDISKRKAMQRQIRQQLHDLELLHEISRGLLFGMAPNEICDYLCSISVQRLGLESGIIVRTPINEQTSELLTGCRDTAFADPMILTHVSTAVHSTRDVMVGSLAFFPLVTAEQVIAVFCARVSSEEYFQTHRISLLKSLINLGAIALSDAVARETIKKRAAELEVAVTHRTAELQNAVHELESFTYSVSHDLRAPLRSINGFSEIVLRRYAANLNEEAQKYLNNIVASGVHMSGLIDHLMKYAKLGRRPVELINVSIHRVIKLVLMDLRDRIASSHAIVETPDPDMELVTDTGLLRQILTNLLENALIYVSEGAIPRICIRWQKSSSSVTISVEDNGIGIAPEHMQKIFDIFQRLHPTERYPGTGIGLSIVRKSTALLGGTVTVESKLDIGTTFNIRFPIREDPQAINQLPVRVV